MTTSISVLYKKALASGRRTETLTPPSGLSLKSRRPPWSSTRSCTMASLCLSPARPCPVACRERRRFRIVVTSASAGGNSFARIATQAENKIDHVRGRGIVASARADDRKTSATKESPRGWLGELHEATANLLFLFVASMFPMLFSSRESSPSTCLGIRRPGRELAVRTSSTSSVHVHQPRSP